jgi:hypothetical protein
MQVAIYLQVYVTGSTRIRIGVCTCAISIRIATLNTPVFDAMKNFAAVESRRCNFQKIA